MSNGEMRTVKRAKDLMQTHVHCEILPTGYHYVIHEAEES